ncbi:hypothetical protein MZD82_24900, partial [Escherichia coli]|nr:hypothetical protein [Escherichia coli]
DRNRSHWSTSKTPSYTKSVSWQHHRNAGSHRYENVTADDLDNSYEIMNFILRDLYSDNRKKVSELANNLDKKFNPQKQKG